MGHELWEQIADANQSRSLNMIGKIRAHFFIIPTGIKLLIKLLASFRLSQLLPRPNITFDMVAHHTWTGHTFLSRFYVSDVEAATACQTCDFCQKLAYCLIVKTGHISMPIDPAGS